MLSLEDYHNLVVLTGAGISVASGLRPYRGPGGLWEENPDAQRMATVEYLKADPDGLREFFAPLREAARKARPNPAHEALARLEERCRKERREFTLLTQNVDGLHQAAGSQNVVELHGSIRKSRCTQCPLPARETDAARCECGAPMRPDIVLFGEYLPDEAEYKARTVLRDVDFFLAVGTSGTVAPASNFVRAARANDARTVLVNLDPSDYPNFDDELLGKAEEVLPTLFLQGEG